MDLLCFRALFIIGIFRIYSKILKSTLPGISWILGFQTFKKYLDFFYNLSTIRVVSAMTEEKKNRIESAICHHLLQLMLALVHLP